MPKMTGAEIFIRALELEGVEYIFGYPGGAVLDIYDKLKFSNIDHILVRHEQAAAIAADGYARVTGKVGVCLATSGPGATNLVTGLAIAHMDSIPVVAFTGQVPTYMIGNDAFQEVDTVGITRPISKYNFLVKKVDELADTIKKAFYLAKTGRPGVVVVDLPKDVIREVTEFFDKEYKSKKVDIRGYKPNLKGHIGQIKKAAKELVLSARPVLYVGGGVIASEAWEEIRELSELLNIPVTTTLMALGAIPYDHPNYLYMLGMHGSYAANMAITECDLLLAVGARFDDRVTGKIEEFAPYATIVHIDIDPAEIGKNKQPHIPIVGDAKLVLKELIKEVKKLLNKYPQTQEIRKKWLKQVQKWKEMYPFYYEPSDRVIKPQYVVEKLSELTNGEAIVTTEVGQNQMWAAQFYKVKKPRHFLSSGGLGAMGYGLPAAIGAQIAKPEATVIDIAGDGSIQMNIQELATATQYNLPIKIAILNNGFLGMVRQWQGMFYDKNYSSVCLSVQPDFVKLAESYGAVGLRAEKPDEVEDVIKEALSIKDKPVVMDFICDREEDVLPFVPPGMALKDMVLPKYKSKKKAKRKAV